MPQRPPINLFALASVLVLLAGSALSAQAPEKKPAEFEVRLPADADLEVDGFKMRATGEARVFQSPPLAEGTYVYTLKASWRAKTVSRAVRLKPGEKTTIDLREALESVVPASSPGSMALQVPSSVTLLAGQWTKVRVQIKRSDYAGPVTLALRGLPKGIAAGETVVAAGSTEGTIEVTASADAAASSGEISVVGTGDKVVEKAGVRLTVNRPKPPAPVPPSSIVLKTPGSLGLVAGEWIKLRVQFERKNYQGPVTVGLRDLPRGIAAGEATVAADASEATLHIIASPEAAGTAGKLVVSGTGGQVSGKIAIPFTVAPPKSSPASPITTPVKPNTPGTKPNMPATKPDSVESKLPKPPVKPSAQTGLDLQLDPPELVLSPGQAKIVRLQVRLKDSGTLGATPKISLEVSNKAVQVVTWSAGPAPDGKSYTKAFAVRAATQAPEGKSNVRFLATAADNTAAAILHVSIQKKAQQANSAESASTPEVQAGNAATTNVKPSLPATKPDTVESKQPPLKPSAETGLDLQLDPSELVLAPGQAKIVRLQARLKDSATRGVTPKINLEVSNKAVQVVTWSAGPAPDGKSYTKAFAVRATSQAPEGKSSVRFLATAADHTAAAILQVSIQKKTQQARSAAAGRSLE